MEFTDDCSFFNLFAKKEVLLESSCKTSPPNKKRRQKNVPRDYLRIAGDIRRKRCRDPTLCGIKCRAPTKMAPLADRGSLLCGNGAGDVRRQPDSSTARVIHPLCGVVCRRATDRCLVPLRCRVVGQCHSTHSRPRYPLYGYMV